MPSIEFWLQAIPLLMVSTIFYCVVLRPSRVAEHKRYQSVLDLKGGERVLLASGMLATVVVPPSDEHFLELPGGLRLEVLTVELPGGVRVEVTQEGIKKIMPTPAASATPDAQADLPELPASAA